MRSTSCGLRRRSVLKIAGVGSLVGLAGCTGAEENGDGSEPDDDGSDDGGTDDTERDGGRDENGDDAEAETVRFLLDSSESDDVVAEYAPLFEYLEAAANVEIEPLPVAGHEAALEMLQDEEADLADVSPSTAIAGEDVIDVIGIRVISGSGAYFATITTETDSGVEELSDLEGDLISFADEYSVSGTLYPLFMLSEAGLDIGDAPRDVPVDFDADYTDHTTARENMLNRADVMAAGAGVFAVVEHVPADQFSDRFHERASYDANEFNTTDPELRLLAESDPIPNAPIVAHSNWDGSVRADVEEALLAAEAEDLVPDPDADDALWFTGVEPGESSDLDPIRDMMETLGLDPSDIS